VSALSIAASAREPGCGIGLPWDWGRDPDLWLYRDRTVAILLRYLRLSVETGRLPSVLGREFFRTHVTSHQLTSFEDVVIFVHDIERCISKLDPLGGRLIAKISMQGYTCDEAARLEGCSRWTVLRKYRDAIDQLSEILLKVGILNRIEPLPEEDEEACQEAESDEKLVTM
jgi:DNA-directed RNA polymerase specialized sigma24 family protein